MEGYVFRNPTTILNSNDFFFANIYPSSCREVNLKYGLIGPGFSCSVGISVFLTLIIY